VTAAALMLGDGVTALIGLTALAGSTRFEIEYHGSSGRLLATDRSLVHVSADGASQAVALASDSRSIDADFVESIRMGTSPSCPASEALGTVRLLDAIARSSATGQVVRLS
jgi:predicted dehydrogenase